ncbi:uncharacterized protein L203_101769 [Cryptococcus depauperatus CBS 7841]|uniref:Subtelomeric hrmA-associated cluster protein AFUB-079030/YDR124W-like helical bundle domain-containing protein n=1 Tax=Cryptococcus depauperatus CBS 7841 TaxID=1295531 RepID=A0A1E3IHA5_9TREE|nr:hypothetical protein L203_03005 [Cryptococcus depauperatus CBS 7841]
MPRIAARTECYDTLRECMRHYKSKRDHLLHHLGKTSYIDGSQFVIAFISPKGEVDTFQSTYLKEPFEKNGKGNGGGILNMDALKQHAAVLKSMMKKRREEEGKATRKPAFLVQESSEAVGSDNEDVENDQEEIENGDVEDVDPEDTLVNETSTLLVDGGDSKVSSSTPSYPEYCLTLQPAEILSYFEERFAAVHQDTCKIVAKAWIKVVEPKKQSKYPYNKGENSRPKWWPKDVEHRAPDHISKEQRIALLIHILTSGIAKVCDLELSTASAMVWIPHQKMEMLRKICLVGRTHEKWKQTGDTSKPLVVPIPPSLRQLVEVEPVIASLKFPQSAPIFSQTRKRSRSHSRLSISTIHSTHHDAKHSRLNPDLRSHSSQQVGESAWKSRLVAHYPRCVPLGVQMNEPRHNSSLSQSSLHQTQSSLNIPSHAGANYLHHQHNLTGIMARHHSMYETTDSRSPVYITQSMASRVAQNFKSQNASTFLRLNTLQIQTASESASGSPRESSSEPLSATASFPTPISAPPPLSVLTPTSAHLTLSQPLSTAVTSTSDGFVRSASAQGYMQQQQIAYLQTHPPLGYDFLQTVSAPVYGQDVSGSESQVFGHFGYQGQEYDYGMPTISDQRY